MSRRDSNISLSLLGSVSAKASSVLIISLISGLVYSPTSQAVEVATGCYRALTVGHRGTNAGVTENTRAAFGKAIADGAEVVELDIHKTKKTGGSEAWIINHDAYIGGKKIAKTSYAQLKKIKPELTTMRSALAYLSTAKIARTKTPVRVQIEMKPSSTTKANMKYFARMIKEYKMQGRVEITSFHKKSLKKWKSKSVQKYAKGISYGLISRSAISASTAKKYGNLVVFNKAAVTAARTAEMNRARIKVYVYTVNTQTEWSRYSSYGVTGIITDNSRGYSL